MKKSSFLITALLFNIFLMSQTLLRAEVKNLTGSPIFLDNGSPIVAVSTPPFQGNGGLNPAHGLPGHSCEIAVGAPLNSAPTKTNVPVQNLKPGETFPLMLANPGKNNSTVSSVPVQTVPVQTAPVPKPTTAPTKSTTSSATGLNPAHGQPNHRCDVPVGSPLNSKPTSKPTIPAQAVIPAAGPVKVNATISAGLKLNPAHGQPGHDCSIKVGEPLKQ